MHNERDRAAALKYNADRIRHELNEAVEARIAAWPELRLAHGDTPIGVCVVKDASGQKYRVALAVEPLDR
jgi:hypothetical protein